MAVIECFFGAPLSTVGVVTHNGSFDIEVKFKRGLWPKRTLALASSQNMNSSHLHLLKENKLRKA